MDLGEKPCRWKAWTVGTLLCLMAGLPCSFAQQASTKLYWYDRGTYTFQRANPDGSQVEHDLTQPVRGLEAWVFDPQQPIIYGGSHHRLFHIPLDGKPPEILVESDIAWPNDVAVTDQYVFWYDVGLRDIRRANRDGSGLRVIARNIWCHTDLEVDEARGHLYWSDVCNYTIRRANLDGTSPVALMAPADSLVSPDNLALDLVHDRIYWVDIHRDIIQSADLSGQDIRDVVLEGIESPEAHNGIAIDPVGGKIYWTDIVIGISRANLDGSDVEVVVPEEVLSRDDDPYSIQLDLDMQRMYWLDVEKHMVASANLDGTDIRIERSNVSGRHLTLHEGYFYWSGSAITRSPVDQDIFTTVVERNTSVGSVYDIAFDATTQTLLWSSQYELRAFNLNAPTIRSVTPLVSSGPYIALAMDSRFRHLYVFGVSGLFRVDVASEQVEHVPVLSNVPWHASLDTERNHIYWAESREIYRVNLDGTGLETVIDSVRFIQGLAVDARASKLYWTGSGRLGIERANLDGTDRESIYIGGAPDELGLRYAPQDPVNTEALVNRPHLKVQAFPNPSHDAVTLQVNVPNPGPFTIGVFNMLGAQVYEQTQFASAPGQQDLRLDATTWASGVYLVRLSAAQHQAQTLLVRTK